MNTHTTPTCITKYKGDLSGKRVLVRAELNAPIANGAVEDDFRIKRFLPTLNYLQEQGAITIVLAHMGREIDDTLEPVVEYLSDHVSNMMFYKNFFHSYGTDEFQKNSVTLQDDLSRAENGDVLVLDNIRQTKAEKENDKELALVFHELADIYVNDAFPVSHRKHTSSYGISMLFTPEQKYSGITFHMEHINLSKALKPTSPSVFILGGAKFDTKLPLIESFLPLYDHIFIGGALANNLIDLAGYNVGVSLVEELTENQRESLQRVLASDNFILPSIVTCETSSGEILDKKLENILETDNILDVSPETITENRDIFINASTILWNGPLGYYEGGYTAGSKELAKLVGLSKAHSIAGGGDTIAAIYEAKQEDNFTFLSSAGGAMIDFLADGDLPGIEALVN